MIDYSKDDWYALVSRTYKDRTEARSGLPLMNHIDEGFRILEAIGANDAAMRAYFIHPLVQDDESLKKFFYGEERIENMYGADWNGEILLLAMEYRSVANAFLSDMTILGVDQIRLSPLKEVNDMLIASKVLDRKNFENLKNISRDCFDILDKYFKLWLERLGISERQYQKLCKISVRTSS